ncbi:MAG: hypothetical protein ACXVDW_15040, partial [Bacteroidia bacterium]
MSKEIVDLYEELEGMSEQTILNKIKHFKISLEIFENNYIELIHHLEKHNDPIESIKLLKIDTRKELFAYQREITRYLHNYIASALSLVDHSRNHFRELYTDESFPEYQQEIDLKFKLNPLANFIKDLRQYFQHYKIPGVSTNVKFENNKIEMKLLLPLKEISLFSGWRAKSKEFLNQHKDDIDIIIVIKQYHQLVIEFYDWFQAKQMDIHKPDKDKVDRHVHKIRQLELLSLLEKIKYEKLSIKEFESLLFRMFAETDIKPVKESKETLDRLT